MDFYRGWDDYENGFGDLNGEFWLGLHKIYRLTDSDTQYQLRIDLKDFSHVHTYAKYSSFKVFDLQKWKFSISVLYIIYS